MAANEALPQGRRFTVTPTDGGLNPGDPLVCGQIYGVSLNGGGLNPQAIDMGGVYSLSVKGIDQVGNSAVAVGDIIYYTAADTPKLSKKNTGVRFGYALDPVTSAATATIRVRLGV